VCDCSASPEVVVEQAVREGRIADNAPEREAWTRAFEHVPAHAAKELLSRPAGRYRTPEQDKRQREQIGAALGLDPRRVL